MFAYVLLLTESKPLLYTLLGAIAGRSLVNVAEIMMMCIRNELNIRKAIDKLQSHKHQPHLNCGGMEHQVGEGPGGGTEGTVPSTVPASPAHLYAVFNKGKGTHVPKIVSSPFNLQASEICPLVDL